MLLIALSQRRSHLGSNTTQRGRLAISCKENSDSNSIATDIIEIEICDYCATVTGLGLFATKPIKRGVYIATYRGERITTEEADRREARGAKYLFEINKRWTIDGSPRWNIARYINHSCRPNAKPVGRRGGIVIVALRRIEPGEEITYDYGRDYLKYFLENCGCASTPSKNRVPIVKTCEGRQSLGACQLTGVLQKRGSTQ